MLACENGNIKCRKYFGFLSGFASLLSKTMASLLHSFTITSTINILGILPFLTVSASLPHIDVFRLHRYYRHNYFWHNQLVELTIFYYVWLPSGCIFWSVRGDWWLTWYVMTNLNRTKKFNFDWSGLNTLQFIGNSWSSKNIDCFLASYWSINR